jgi:hypothetical protein
MQGETSQRAQKGWHVAQWPPLAWLETAIKLAAIVVGVTALVGALSDGTWAWPSGWRLAQLGMLAFLALGLLVAILDRVAEREVVAMGFVTLNNLGHWGMVAALASAPGPGGLLPAFAGLMLVGDLVKLVFLQVHQYYLALSDSSKIHPEPVEG